MIFLIFVSADLNAQACGNISLDDFTNSLEQEMVGAGMDSVRVSGVLQNSRLAFYPNIFERIEAGRSGPAQPGYNPYDKFLIKNSVNRGKRFLTANAYVLDAAEKRYGVPSETLTAFLRIESNFGASTGKYQVVGVFYSIACLGPPGPGVAEKGWAKKHLSAFLQASERYGFAPLDIHGSYMGAFGLPQFMPTSFLDFAVDGDGDGDIDLYSVEDAVSSIANYLVGHGWNTNPRRAVLSYNNSGRFADFIFEYSSRLK